MLRRQIERLVEFEEGELAPALLATAYFFCLMFGYFMLRPLREAMGLEGGVDSLRVLFLITLAVMVGANVLFSAVVSRAPRRVFVPLVYRFANACLLVFLAIFAFFEGAIGEMTGNVFFVWLSVFNLFAITVFWGFLADVFTLEQSKRLFGFIAVGGTAGAIAGSVYASQLAEALGPVGLFASAIVLIEIAAQCAIRLGKRAERAPDMDGGETPLGGASWAGLREVLASPYLLAIALTVIVYTICSTLLYFERARIIETTAEERDARASLFATIELAGQSATILVQLFLTGRLMKFLGVGALLAIVPVVTIAGFAAITLAPTILALALFEAARKASNYAASRPARETLFTVVKREEKYKAKSLIDTFVYRGGDAVGALADKGLALLAAPAAFLAIPLGGVGVGLAAWLGWAERRRARRAALDFDDTVIPAPT